MHVVDLIRKKRDGGALSDAEIAFLVAGAATNTIPEYQLSAWLMAVVWRGLGPEELQLLVGGHHPLTQHLDVPSQTLDHDLGSANGSFNPIDLL